MKLRRLTDSDIPTVQAWLDRPHVAAWFPHPDAWMEEIRKRDTEFDFIRHFIAEEGSRAFGFFNIMTTQRAARIGRAASLRREAGALTI